MRLSTSIASLFLALASTSCFAVTDLGRFEEDNTPILGPNDFSDLRVTVRNMAAHVADPFEYRVVDGSNVVQSRGVIQPLGTSDTSIVAQRAVPKRNGPFHVDFFVVKNGAPGPGWRVDLDEQMRTDTGLFTIDVDANASPTDIDAPAPPSAPGRPATVNMRNLKPYESRRIEVRVARADTLQLVALYRIPTLATETAAASVPGVITPSAAYRVEVYTDDGKASAGTIAAFRYDASATEAGFDSVWDANQPGVAVGDAPVP